MDDRAELMRLLRTFRPPSAAAWGQWTVGEREAFLHYLVQHPRLFEYLGNELTPYVTAYVRERDPRLQAKQREQMLREAFPNYQWGWVPRVARVPVPARPVSNARKLTDLERLDLARFRHETGVAFRRVGKLYGVSETLARKIYAELVGELR